MINLAACESMRVSVQESWLKAAKVDRLFSPLLKAPAMFCPLGRKTPFA